MSSFIEGIERRQALVLLRDIVFAYVALNTTYQLGTALYHRGVSGVFTDCGRWIKLVARFVVMIDRVGFGRRDCSNGSAAFQRPMQSSRQNWTR